MFAITDSGSYIKIVDGTTSEVSYLRKTSIDKILTSHIVRQGGGSAGNKPARPASNLVQLVIESGTFAFDLADVSNQGSWTVDQAGLIVAANAIAAWL